MASVSRETTYIILYHLYCIDAASASLLRQRQTLKCVKMSFSEFHYPDQRTSDKHCYISSQINYITATKLNLIFISARSQTCKLHSSLVNLFNLFSSVCFTFYTHFQETESHHLLTITKYSFCLFFLNIS